MSNVTKLSKRKSSPEYRSWASMKTRCNNPNHMLYHRYGGRGIKVCPQWHAFDAFFRDMGSRPDGLTLDRIDNDKGYSPENCRWATRSEQIRNRSNTRALEPSYAPEDGFKPSTGVRFLSKRNRWIARVCYNGLHRHVYYGHSYEEAVKARAIALQQKLEAQS